MKLTILITLLLLLNTTENFPQDFDKLGEAVLNKDTLRIEKLLSEGIDINVRDSVSGATVLFIACSYPGYDDMVNLLLKHGAEVNVTDNKGKTPLIWAAGNSVESTKLLLEHGADVHAKANDGMNAIMQAVFGILSKRVTTDVIDLLLEYGADINSTITRKDAAGWTALLFASVEGDKELVDYLIRHGADVNHTSDDGQTTLSLAKQEKYKDIVKLLKKFGALE